MDFNWDVNWNFNHGSKSSSNTEEASTTTSTTTTTTTTTTTEAPKTDSTTASSSSGNYNGQFGHKKFDVNWSFDFNHGSAVTSATKTSSIESSSKDSHDQVTKSDDAFWSLEEDKTINDNDKGKEKDIDPTDF